jgi:hypothetical protein
MENTFKGYTVEEIMDNVIFGLKLVVEERLASKLDGMLNTDNAHVVDEDTTIYYVEGLYKGGVGGRNLEDIIFVVMKKTSMGIYY